MGKVNLLTGSYVGKVGEQYGSDWKGIHCIKAVPFSHAPHSETQTKSVRAFECVNRIAGSLAKKFWKNLNLSDRKMLKHNAVAQFLKPLIFDHAFVISNWSALCRQDGNTFISQANIDRLAGTFSCAAVLTDIGTWSDSTESCVLLVDEVGKVVMCETFSGQSFSQSIMALLDPGRRYYCLLARSDLVRNKWFPNSFTIRECLYLDAQ